MGFAIVPFAMNVSKFNEIVVLMYKAFSETFSPYSVERVIISEDVVECLIW